MEHAIYIQFHKINNLLIPDVAFITWKKIFFTFNIAYTKVALGVCFALKFVERRFTIFHIFNYLM